MPEYTCEKCARVFTQKGRLTSHQNRKTPCTKTTAINEVISQQVAVKVKEAVKKELSSKQPVTKENLQSFFEDLHNLLWNRAGLNPEKALEHMIFFFAYRMIELQADALNLPQECRWSYIAALKDENELASTIRTGVASFRSKPKTKPFFKMHEIQKAELIYDIVEQINRVTLETLQETDVLGDIFEHMLSRGMSTMSDEGQYFTNRAICRLAFKLAYDIKKTVRRPDGTLCTFADWFCGTGGFAAEYVKGVKQVLGDVKPNWKKDCASIYCQDMNLSSITTTLLNLLIMTGQPFGTETIRSVNSFSDSITVGTDAPFKGLQVDYCFMNPPYGGDKTKGKDYKFKYSKGKGTEKQYLVNQDIRTIGIEDDDKVSAGVQLAMATLSAEGGVCAIVLPQGFFFGASKKAVELRKKIAEEYKIHYVVDIASGAFANTGTKTSMLVFQRGAGSTEKVKFIGMDEQELVEASLEDLRGKNYSLNYKQYLPQEAVEMEGFKMVKLGDVCEIESGTYITKKTAIEGPYPVYGGGDVSAHISEYNREAKYVIAKDGVSQECVRFVPGKFYLNHHGWTFKVKDNILYHYLGYWLLNNQHMIYNLATGTAQKGVNQISFYNIQIPLPSLERQQQIVEAIDDWTTLVHQEEQALKTLEKQVMFQVKEMGRGKERVKLGDVCEFKRGKMITKKELVEGDFPVIGGGLTPMGYHNTSNREAYTTLISQSGENAGHVSRYTKPVWASDCFSASSTKMTMDFLYYSMLQIQDDINFLKTGTAQPHIYPSSIESLTIPLPSLAEQQTLQSDFDEIRHKHAKIATYKAKAHEAIQRLIPTVNPV
jgi:type I restriction enzyme S subunit